MKPDYYDRFELPEAAYLCNQFIQGKQKMLSPGGTLSAKKEVQIIEQCILAYQFQWRRRGWQNHDTQIIRQYLSTANAAFMNEVIQSESRQLKIPVA